MSTNSSCHNIHHHRHSCRPFLITPKLWKLFSELKESWSDCTCQYEPPPHSWNPVVTSEIPSSIKHDPVTTGGKMRLKALGGQTDTNTWYQQQTKICTHGKIPPQIFFLSLLPTTKKQEKMWTHDYQIHYLQNQQKKHWTQNSFMFFMGHVARSAALICCQSQRTESDSILREKKKVFLSLRESFSDSQFQGICHRLFPLLSSCLQGEWYMYHMYHLVSMQLQHKCTGLVLQSPVQLHPQSSITPHPTPISQQQNPNFPNP